MTRQPDFLVIGAMKCATSTLHVQLGLQPGLFTPALKEPGYFSHDAVYAKGAGWYSELFAFADPGDLCGESSTHYTKLPTYPQTVERMHRDLGDVKLVYMMRDPIDRVVSQYIHEWTQREISGSLDVAIDRHPELVDYSRYAMQLEPYFDAFGRHRVLPVFLERLRAEPQAELERVARFVGYRGEVKWHRERERQNASEERLRKSALRSFVVEAPVLRTVRRRMVPQPVRDRLKGWWRMNERPSLSEPRRADLERIFDADLARLGDWLGVELRCRDFAETVARRSLEWASRDERRA